MRALSFSRFALAQQLQQVTFPVFGEQAHVALHAHSEMVACGPLHIVAPRWSFWRQRWLVLLAPCVALKPALLYGCAVLPGIKRWAPSFAWLWCHARLTEQSHTPLEASGTISGG